MGAGDRVAEPAVRAALDSVGLLNTKGRGWRIISPAPLSASAARGRSSCAARRAARSAVVETPRVAAFLPPSFPIEAARCPGRIAPLQRPALPRSPDEEP